MIISRANDLFLLLHAGLLTRQIYQVSSLEWSMQYASSTSLKWPDNDIHICVATYTEGSFPEQMELRQKLANSDSYRK